MAHLVLPNGKGHGWRPDTPDINDEPHSFKRQAIPKKPVPSSFYLDPTCLSAPYDQGQQGSCTGHGTKGALEWSYRRKRQVSVTLSPAYAYLQARILEASVNEDSGAEIRDVVKGAVNKGVSLLKYAPYSDKVLYKKPTKAADKNALGHQVCFGYHRTDVVDDIVQALLNDMPVIGGYSWFSNLSTADFERTGVMTMPVAGRDKLEGGHCNWACGFDTSSRMFLLQNSYGADFGAKHPISKQGGFVLMPFAYIEQGLADDFWAISHE
jgi:hypothetical protein